MNSQATRGARAAQPLILRREQVLALCGISGTTLHRWMEREGFPRPRQLGPRAVGWLLAECQEWLQARPVAGQGAARAARAVRCNGVGNG